jgi:hypothetical protein
MPLKCVRFTIGRLMAVVAGAAIVLGLPHYPPGALLAAGLGGLVLAFTCWARAARRAPSTEFLCALIGIIVSLLFMPAPENRHSTVDFGCFVDLSWLIGYAAAGALVGAVVARADRRIVRGRC